HRSLLAGIGLSLPPIIRHGRWWRNRNGTVWGRLIWCCTEVRAGIEGQAMLRVIDSPDSAERPPCAAGALKRRRSPRMPMGRSGGSALVPGPPGSRSAVRIVLAIAGVGLAHTGHRGLDDTPGGRVGPMERWGRTKRGSRGDSDPDWSGRV